jgi:hypothetical protein
MIPTDDGILILAICTEYVEVFSKAKQQKLSPHLSTNNAIDLEPG